MNHLPDEIVAEIYSHDSQKYDLLKQLNQEYQTTRQIFAELTYLSCLTDHKLSRILKQVSKRHRKLDLKRACYYLRIRMPKRITKFRLMLMIYEPNILETKLKARIDAAHISLSQGIRFVVLNPDKWDIPQQ